MTTGVGIALIAIGAILAFAVNDGVSGVDLRLIGFILIAAGALGLVLGLTQMSRGRVTSRRTVTDSDGRSRQEYTEQDLG